MIPVVKRQSFGLGDGTVLLAFAVTHIRLCCGSAGEIQARGAIVLGSSDVAELWTQLAAEIRLDYQLPKSSMSSDFREAPV
jgi:hypothetical protein